MHLELRLAGYIYILASENLWMPFSASLIGLRPLEAFPGRLAYHCISASKDTRSHVVYTLGWAYFGLSSLQVGLSLLGAMCALAARVWTV